MKKLSYGLSGGFSKAQLETIRSQTLLVLQEVGVAVPHEGILKYLSGIKGIKVNGERVHYSPDLIERHFDMIRRENGDYTFRREDESGWVMRPAYLCLNYYDTATGMIRPSTTEDLRRAAKLCDFYGMAGTSPLHPQDVPEHMRQINTLRVCLENSKAVGRWMTARNEKEARYLIAMAEAAGRQEPHVILQITISPLRLNTEYLEILLEHRGAESYLRGATIGGGAIPMLGATGPLSAPAAWVQATAEAVAGYVTAKLIDPRVMAHCSSNMFPFDMRKACMVLGSPEGALARLMSFQINDYLFGFKKGATMGAMGLPLDAQSSAEKMGNALLEALAGTRVFYDIGMTPLDFMFCLEQVVLDREIINWIRRFVEGFEINDDKELLLRTMREGISSDVFYLMHDDTVANHRKFYWEPELFQYGTIATIMADPNKRSLAERARDIAERDLARHSFGLPADVRKELDALCRKADAELGGLHG